MRKLSLALALLLPSIASATVARWLEIDELLAASQLVVRARVVDQSPAASPDAKPRTHTTLEVLQTYKGSAPATVIVRQIAGATEHGSTHVEGDAFFEPGEEVVVFLLAVPDAPGVFVLTALSQAKFTLDRTEDGPLLHRDLGDLGFWTGGAVLRTEDPPVSLPIFESTVRDLMRVPK